MAKTRTFEEFKVEFLNQNGGSSKFVLMGLIRQFRTNYALFNGQCSIRRIPTILEQTTSAYLDGLDWEPKEKPADTCILLKSFGYSIIHCLFVREQDRFAGVKALSRRIKSLTIKRRKSVNSSRVSGRWDRPNRNRVVCLVQPQASFVKR